MSNITNYKGGVYVPKGFGQTEIPQNDYVPEQKDEDGEVIPRKWADYFKYEEGESQDKLFFMLWVIPGKSWKVIKDQELLGLLFDQFNNLEKFE